MGIERAGAFVCSGVRVKQRRSEMIKELEVKKIQKVTVCNICKNECHVYERSLEVADWVKALQDFNTYFTLPASADEFAARVRNQQYKNVHICQICMNEALFKCLENLADKGAAGEPLP